MGAAEAHRHAEALGAADGDVGAQLAHRRQQHLGQRIDRHRAHQPRVRGGPEQGLGIPEPAAVPRQLQQQTERPLRQRLGRQILRVHQLQLDPQGLGPGVQQGQGLGEHLPVHEEAAGLVVPAHGPGQSHRLGGGCGLIEQGGVADRQAGELADQGLEVEQGLQSPLGDLGLVGGVGGVPGGVLEHVALQQCRGGRVVVPLADQAAHHAIAGGDGGQLRQGRGLVTGLGEALEGLLGAEQDIGRHHLGGELLQGLEAQLGEHAPLLPEPGAEVATGETRALGHGLGGGGDRAVHQWPCTWAAYWSASISASIWACSLGRISSSQPSP